MLAFKFLRIRAVDIERPPADGIVGTDCRIDGKKRHDMPRRIERDRR